MAQLYWGNLSTVSPVGGWMQLVVPVQEDPPNSCQMYEIASSRLMELMLSEVPEKLYMRQHFTLGVNWDTDSDLKVTTQEVGNNMSTTYYPNPLSFTHRELLKETSLLVEHQRTLVVMAPKESQIPKQHKEWHSVIGCSTLTLLEQTDY